MLSAEWQILLSNSVIIMLGYLLVYPRFCGANMQKY